MHSGYLPFNDDIPFFNQIKLIIPTLSLFMDNTLGQPNKSNKTFDTIWFSSSNPNVNSKTSVYSLVGVGAMFAISRSII